MALILSAFCLLNYNYFFQFTLAYICLGWGFENGDYAGVDENEWKESRKKTATKRFFLLLWLPKIYNLIMWQPIIKSTNVQNKMEEDEMDKIRGSKSFLLCSILAVFYS